MSKKKFAPLPDPINPLAKNRGGCIATDMITVEGRKVGYMYRDEPNNEQDSGWVFTSGLESQSYMDNAANHGIYDVNTIANYDPDIVPFVDAPIGTAFEREGLSGRFVQVGGEPWEPSASPSPQVNNTWPPPGFPIVEGDHRLTASWSIMLPKPFARRVEDGQLVLWRPAFTIWLTAWGNDLGESQATRLAGIKEAASPNRYAEEESKANHLTRYSYRLRDENENGPLEALYGFVIGDSAQLHLSIYFDDPAYEAEARGLVASITEHKESKPE